MWLEYLSTFSRSSGGETGFEISLILRMLFKRCPVSSWIWGSGGERAV